MRGKLYVLVLHLLALGYTHMAFDEFDEFDDNYFPLPLKGASYEEVFKLWKFPEEVVTLIGDRIVIPGRAALKFYKSDPRAIRGATWL